MIKHYFYLLIARLNKQVQTLYDAKLKSIFKKIASKKYPRTFENHC